MDGYAPSDLIFEEDLDEDDQEIMDYVNIMVDDVPKQMGSNFKKIDLPNYCCFDCQPARRAKLKDDEELYPISNMPEYLRSVFGAITHLNQL